MTLCIGVYPQKQVELAFGYFYSAVQIPTLEQTIEYPLS